VLPWPWSVEQPALTQTETHHAGPLLFDRAVSQYVEIRRLQQPIDVDCLTADLEVIQGAREKLAAAIRDARGAGQGSVFGAEVATTIRRRLDRALEKHPYDAMLLGGLATDAASTRVPIAVNGTLPWGIAVRLAPSLLAELPSLPEELEYRLIGRDLILWDAGTDLVVDILPDALPAR
jgi:hypothetical protein